MPNELFYDNELRACADVVLRNSLCNWDGLKRPGFPVIFEAVFGKDQREESSPSFFNAEEVSVVLRYVRELKDARGIPLQMSEIGIISPYHRQASCVADNPYFFGKFKPWFSCSNDIAISNMTKDNFSGVYKDKAEKNFF